MTMKTDITHLYLHVPFCRTICSYCDFCHVVYRRETADRWLQALARQLAGSAIAPQKTVYIGGGTPSCLDHDQLETLLLMVSAYRDRDCEFTVELNPESMDEEKAELLVKYGVNRVSIGYQTNDAAMLKMMNRRHSAKDVNDLCGMLKRHGIDNISLDIMYSLPGQTMDQMQNAVRTALEMNPTHLSLYSLMVEEHTVFGRKGIQPCDEDTEADMYEWIMRTLPEYGYEQYEISNFARDGLYSAHNLAYWHYDDFYGFSCGASGKEGLLRYDNTRDLKAYLNDPFLRNEIPLSEEEAMFEHVMMELRLKQGMSLEAFRDRRGREYMDVFGKKTEALITQGLLETDGRNLKATERGYEILNTVLEELMDE